MKKVILFATACLFVSGVALADNGKGKNKKKCAKGKTCCSKEKDAKASAGKACCKDKTTAKM
jgi:hypothetical protein